MNAFQKILLAVVLVEIPLRLDVHLDYHPAAVELGALGGWNVSLTLFCLLLLYGHWLLRAVVRHDPLTRSALHTMAPALCYLLAVAVSVVVADHPRFALFELLAQGQAFLLFLFVARWVRTRQEVRFVVTLLLLGLALQGVLMIGARSTGGTVDLVLAKVRVDDGGRVGGTIGSPNEAGSYLTLMMLVALGAGLSRWPWGYRVLAGAAFALGSLAMVTTLSRGAWLGCGVAIALFCLFAWLRGRLSLLLPLTLLVSALVVGVVFSDAISARLTRDDKGSAASRVPLMHMAWSVTKRQPVFGVGANNLALALPPYGFSKDYRGGFVFVVHNRYLQVLAETGAVGLLALLWFLLSSLGRAWRCWRGNDDFLAPLALALCAGMCGEMLHITVETFNGRSQGQLLWVLAGLAAALDQIARQTAPRAPDAPVRPCLVPVSDATFAGERKGGAPC